MESVLPHIIEYVPQPWTLSSVSSGWRESLSNNDRMILESLQKRYPTNMSLLDLVKYIFLSSDSESLAKIFNLSSPIIKRLPWKMLIQLSQDENIYRIIHNRFPAYRDIDTEKRLHIYDNQSRLSPEDIRRLGKNTYTRMTIYDMITKGNTMGLEQILRIIGKDVFLQMISSVSMRQLIYNNAKSTSIHWMNKYGLNPSNIEAKSTKHITPYTNMLWNIVFGSKEETEKALASYMESGGIDLLKERISTENIIPILAHVQTLLLEPTRIYLQSIGMDPDWIRYYFSNDIGGISVPPQSFWTKLLASAIAYDNKWLVERMIKRHKGDIGYDIRRKMLQLPSSKEMKDFIKSF